MRRFQHVHIILVITLLVGLFISFYFGITSFKEMMNTKQENLKYPSTIPMLVTQKIPYKTVEYKNLISFLNPSINFPNINVEVKNDQIHITSQTVEAEEEVLSLMLSLLSIDKNLQVISICGKAGNSCNYNALEFIVKGEKTSTDIKLTPL